MGEGGQDRRSSPAANTHIFLAPIRAQVVRVSITGVLVWGISGPIAQVCVCVFGKMSKVDVIEQVNTIWEQRHWTRTKAVHLLQRKNSEPLAITQSVSSQIHHSVLHNPSSHLRPASTCCPAAFRASEYEDGGQQGSEAAQPSLLFSWSGEGLEGLLGFN